MTALFCQRQVTGHYFTGFWMFAKLVLILDKDLQQETSVTMDLIQILETRSPPFIQATLPHLSPKRRGDALSLRKQTHLGTAPDSLTHLTLPHTFREEHTQIVKRMAPLQEVREETLERADTEQTHSVCKERDFSVTIACQIQLLSKWPRARSKS